MKYIVNGFLLGVGFVAGTSACKEMVDKVLPELLDVELPKKIINYGEYKSDPEK